MTSALQSVCLSGGNSHKTHPDVFCNFINLYISKRPSNAVQRNMHNDVRVLTVPLYANRVVHDAHQALLNCMHDGPNRLTHSVTNCLQRGCGMTARRIQQHAPGCRCDFQSNAGPHGFMHLTRTDCSSGKRNNRNRTQHFPQAKPASVTNDCPHSLYAACRNMTLIHPAYNTKEAETGKHLTRREDHTHAGKISSSGCLLPSRPVILPSGM